MVGRKRGFGWLSCSSLFSVLGGSDVCFPEMFGCEEVWENIFKAGFKVLLSEMWLRYFSVGCFDSCLKDKNDGGVIKTKGICRVQVLCGLI